MMYGLFSTRFYLELSRAREIVMTPGEFAELSRVKEAVAGIHEKQLRRQDECVHVWDQAAE